MKGRPFVHGYEIYLEKATLVYESGTCPLTVLHADGKPERPKLAGGDDATTAFTAEIQAAVDGVRSGHGAGPAQRQAGARRAGAVPSECESVQTGKIIEVA